MTAMRPETTSEHIARDMREGRFPERSEPQMVADPTGTAPERIWLQDGGDFDAASEVTWCQHSIDDADTEYVRADLAAVQPAQVQPDPRDEVIARLVGALEEIASITVHSGGDVHGVTSRKWQGAFQQAQDEASAALAAAKAVQHG